MNYKQSDNDAKNVHVCEGYVKAETLKLDYSTIERAQKAGIGGLIFKLFTDIMTAVEQLEIKENTYEDIAKIAKVIQDTVSPVLERYYAPGIELASFISPDTGALNLVYLSEYGMFLQTVNQIGETGVRATDPMEIWRYLYPPSKIIENIISTMIAVAEKHKNIKNDWILSCQRINELCLGSG
jgi:hypothetical protein